MRTKFLKLMKLSLLISVFMCCFSSCLNKKNIDRVDMSKILSNCKGHAVIVAKGFNKGNFKSHRYYLIIRDDSLNCFEYIGADYNISVGDTLK